MDTKLETELAYQLMPVRLDDDLLRYAMECSGMNNPEGARAIKAAYHFLLEAARTSERHKEAWVRQTTTEAMAECMDMVRGKLADAGVIDKGVPPMFVAEAVLARLRTVWAAFHVNMLRAFPDRTHAEIDAEIGRVFAGARPHHPAPSDGEIYEAVSRRADPAGHDAALAEAQAVFGSSAGLTPEHKAAQQDENAAARQRLESVTVTEKGTWHVSDWRNGRLAIQSQDFTHDVALEISGDFATPDDKRAQAEEIARRLNAYPTRPYTYAVGAAGEAYYKQFTSAHPLPAQWSWAQLWQALDHAAVARRDLYTCIGKGGAYDLLGFARGAGTMRGEADVIVYRDVASGHMYYRTQFDFGERMQLIEDKP